MITIRNEERHDYKVAEEITGKVFYNLYIPGYAEHYLVYIMCGHEDFILELDLVIEPGGQVIGDIIYTRARLVNEVGTEKGTLTLGPVSITLEYQRRGYGGMLIEHSFEQVVLLGYDVVVILGSPMNYVGCSFKNSRKLNICMENEKYPTATMVKELVLNRSNGRK